MARKEGLVGRAKLEPGTVLYMDYGSQEMGNHEGMRREFAEMCSKIMVRGIHLTSRLVPGGTHSEDSWEKQLPFVFHTCLLYTSDSAPSPLSAPSGYTPRAYCRAASPVLLAVPGCCRCLLYTSATSATPTRKPF